LKSVALVETQPCFCLVHFLADVPVPALVSMGRRGSDTHTRDTEFPV
jgi:hypothetical protein